MWQRYSLNGTKKPVGDSVSINYWPGDAENIQPEFKKYGDLNKENRTHSLKKKTMHGKLSQIFSTMRRAQFLNKTNFRAILGRF